MQPQSRSERLRKRQARNRLIHGKSRTTHSGQGSSFASFRGKRAYERTQMSLGGLARQLSHKLNRGFVRHRRKKPS